MRRFLCFGALVISAASAGSLVRSTGSSRTHRADDGLGNYQFGYEETHSTGGTFRRESGNAAGAKVGSYGLRDIDGRYRVVNYVADAAGFRAQVSTNEPGTAPSLTGAASYNAAPVVASRLTDIASPIYGTRVANAAPAVAPVPAFNALPVYSSPVRVAAPISFGARGPVAHRLTYAAAAPAPVTAYAAPVAKVATAPVATTYAAPVAVYAPQIPAYAAAPVAKLTPVVPSYATRLSRPIATYTAPVPKVPAPSSTYAVPANGYAAPFRTFAAPIFAAPVAAYAAPLHFAGSVMSGSLYSAPVTNYTAAPVVPAARALSAEPRPETASMNSALPAALLSETLRPRNNARLFSGAAADAPSLSTNNAPLSYSANIVAQSGSPNREALMMSLEAPASTSSLSTAESNSTEVVAPRANQPVTFPYSTETNFPVPRVNFSAPQFSFPSPAAFDPAPSSFSARPNPARTAPVSDAPVTPVPSFAPASPVTTTPAPVANSTGSTRFPGPVFNAPFPFAYSFPGSDMATNQQPATAAPPAFGRVSTPFAPRATVPFPSAVSAAFPAGTYAGPVATPRMNGTEQRYSTRTAPSTPAPATTDSPAAFPSSQGDEVPFDHHVTFSSQRLRAPIYAPVVAAAADAPILPQYTVYAPVAHFTSSSHTRVDFSSSAPAVIRSHNQERRAPSNAQMPSMMTPEPVRTPERPPMTPPQAPTPNPESEAPATETPPTPAEPQRFPGAAAPQVPSAQGPGEEATTSLPNGADDEDVADPRNAPPMFSAREETFTTTTQAAPTTPNAAETTIAPTTEVPMAAEADRRSDPVEQRSPEQNDSDAAPLSADRPNVARVVVRRRPSLSVYASRVVRAPSAYRVFVPQYAHVKTAPVAHFAAAPVVISKPAHVSYAMPAVRYY